MNVVNHIAATEAIAKQARELAKQYPEATIPLLALAESSSEANILVFGEDITTRVRKTIVDVFDAVQMDLKRHETNTDS
jgi:hypothetical protein